MIEPPSYNAGCFSSSKSPGFHVRASGRSSRVNGQDNMKGRAAGGVIGAPNASVMRRDDRARDRQPQAKALRLGGEERLEESFLHVCRDPRTAVDDGQLHAVRGGL